MLMMVTQYQQRIKHSVVGDAASCLVHSHHDGVEFLFHLLLLVLVLVGIGVLLVFEPLEGLGALLHDGHFVISGEFVVIVKLELHLEAVVLEVVFLLDLGLDLSILVLVLLGIGNHLVNLFLGETSSVVGDGDFLGLADGLVHGGDVEDTIGIDIESNFDLGGTTGCGGDALEVEFTEQVIVFGHLTLTFEYLDEDTWLVVSVGGESLLLLGGNASVSGDEDSHDTTSGLDTLGEGSDIQKEEILDLLGTLTGEDSGLNGSTEGNSLIGVDGSVEGLSVEEVLEERLDLGDSGGTTNEDDFVDLRLGDIRILKDLLYGGHALSESGHAKFLELSAGDVNVEILTFGKSLTVDLGLMSAGQDSLGLLALGSEATHSSGVTLDLNTGLLLESGHAEFDKDIIEIFTTEMGVTIGGLDLENTILDFEEGDIESATTEIEDKNVLLTLTLFVETVSDSSGGGLVDDTGDVESCDGTGILGGISLGVIEISWDSDDSGLDGLTEISLSNFLHLGEDHGGDLLSLELLLFTLEVDNDHGLLLGAGLDLEGPKSDIRLDSLVRELATDESLGIEDGVLGVSGGLVLGRVTDETLLLSEGNVGWGGVDTLIVGNDLDLVVLPHSNAGVSGSQINSDGTSHCVNVVFFLKV